MAAEACPRARGPHLKVSPSAESQARASVRQVVATQRWPAGPVDRHAPAHRPLPVGLAQRSALRSREQTVTELLGTETRPEAACVIAYGARTDPRLHRGREVEAGFAGVASAGPTVVMPIIPTWAPRWNRRTDSPLEVKIAVPLP